MHDLLYISFLLRKRTVSLIEKTERVRESEIQIERLLARRARYYSLTPKQNPPVSKEHFSKFFYRYEIELSLPFLPLSAKKCCFLILSAFFGASPSLNRSFKLVKATGETFFSSLSTRAGDPKKSFFRSKRERGAIVFAPRREEKRERERERVESPLLHFCVFPSEEARLAFSSRFRIRGRKPKEIVGRWP